MLCDSTEHALRSLLLTQFRCSSAYVELANECSSTLCRPWPVFIVLVRPGWFTSTGCAQRTRLRSEYRNVPKASCTWTRWVRLPVVQFTFVHIKNNHKQYYLYLDPVRVPLHALRGVSPVCFHSKTAYSSDERTSHAVCRLRCNLSVHALAYQLQT